MYDMQAQQRWELKCPILYPCAMIKYLAGVRGGSTTLALARSVQLEGSFRCRVGLDSRVR